MKKIKILFLARRFAPHAGGVETHLHYLNEELKKFKFDISVITEQYSSSQLKTEIVEDVSIIRIPLPHQQTSKFSIWRWVMKNHSIFRSSDIIHIHDVFFWILPIYPLLKLLRKKIYITFHGYEGNKNPTIRQRFWHWLAYLLCNGNICIGAFHAKWYGVKPNSISFGAVKQLLPKIDYGKPTNRITRIVFVGRISDDTGILTYLSALKIIVKKERVTLDVFGDGDLTQVAKKFAERNELPVRFHGFVSRNTIKLSSYDVAFVSQYLAIIECLSVGLPIISYYDTEIKKDYLMLSPFGKWLIITKSAQEIANNIQLSQRRSSEKDTSAAKDWAIKQTWEKLARKYLLLWGVLK